MTTHDHRNREPALPPELALIAQRLGRGSAADAPASLRAAVLGAVVDALGEGRLAESDLLPPARREPWPAALLLLAGLALVLLVAPFMSPPGDTPRSAAPVPRFTDRLAAAGITLHPPAARDDTALALAAPGPDQRSSRFSRGGPEEASIAVLRSLPPDHWLKGTL